MNLKSTTTNGFNFRIINSLMKSWGVRLTWLDCNDFEKNNVNFCNAQDITSVISSRRGK